MLFLELPVEFPRHAPADALTEAFCPLETTFNVPVQRSRSWYSPRLWRLIFGTVAGLALLFYAHHQEAQRQIFENAVANEHALPPVGPPPLTQESVDLALNLYGIKLPRGLEQPRLDMKLHDRGLTTRSFFLEKAIVTVGPAAFSSWALLGSTLAHEIEVHCQQNFLAIYLMDLAGLDGTGAAERQAYLHELSDAKRFGTEREDTRMIAETVAFYYPEEPAGRSAFSLKPVRAWLARSLIGGASAAGGNADRH